MEETKKAPIRVRVNRSLAFFCCMAVLPETCGFGGTCPTLTVSHDNSCDDYVTVVPLIPTGHYVPGEGWQAGSHSLVTVDDKTYMALCDYPVTIHANCLGRGLGYVWPANERNGVLKALAHHFLITKENLL